MGFEICSKALSKITKSILFFSKKSKDSKANYLACSWIKEFISILSFFFRFTGFKTNPLLKSKSNSVPFGSKNFLILENIRFM